MTRLLFPAILLSAAIGTVQAAGWDRQRPRGWDSNGDTITVIDDAKTQHKIRFAVVERALEAIRNAVRTLALSPFSCRKASSGNPSLRELVIPFGASGHVALFEIDDDKTISILAVRHQREDDYH